MNIEPVVLIILDGFGISNDRKYNAIAQAKKPTIDYLFEHYPHTLLQASGPAVGLPENVPGNSEVGHMTIGAGHVIEQPITIISQAIEDGSLFKNKILISALARLAQENKKLHIIGLLSNGFVHSSDNHLYAYAQAAIQAGIKEIYVHAILDGRDVLACSARQFLQRLQDFCAINKQVHLASIAGRFYAMDRDHNWARTRAAYDCMTHQQKSQFNIWQKALDYYYEQNITDEFIPPTQLCKDGIIEQKDGVIFFNVRPERARQLISAFVDPKFDCFPVKHLHLSCFITPVPLSASANITALFQFPPISQTLKEILCDAGKQILSIAETEKYAHVTYFFSGFKEKAFDCEERILIPSLKLKDYAQHPQMSAQGITNAILKELKKNTIDFYIINYANADMVGHSGNLQATIEAVEFLDAQLKMIYEEIIEKRNGTIYITADHGNAELKYDERAKQPHKSHTLNPVPFIWINKAVKDQKRSLSLKTLADIARFILQNFHIPIPNEMH